MKMITSTCRVDCWCPHFPSLLHTPPVKSQSHFSAPAVIVPTTWKRWDATLGKIRNQEIITDLVPNPIPRFIPALNPLMNTGTVPVPVPIYDETRTTVPVLPTRVLYFSVHSVSDPDWIQINLFKPGSKIITRIPRYRIFFSFFFFKKTHKKWAPFLFLRTESLKDFLRLNVWGLKVRSGSVYF